MHQSLCDSRTCHGGKTPPSFWWSIDSIDYRFKAYSQQLRPECVQGELPSPQKKTTPNTVYTAYSAVVGTGRKSRYNPDRSVRGPGPGGHGGVAVGVSGVVMVFVLKVSTRGTRRWFQFLCTIKGSPLSILLC